MADVNMPEFTLCQFDAKGWAPCKKSSDNGWCTEHEGLECRSCGEQAVTSCDAQMGGLVCGAPLCVSCEHGESGSHITKKVADENRRAEREEREARVASRTSSVQRMNEELSVPATLFELLKGDWRDEGYEFRRVYFLELKHSLMSFFPAIFSSDKKRIIFATDLQLLENVWQMLEPREATLRGELAYVNEELGIAYFETERPEERENREPGRLLTAIEFSGVVETSEEPFQWAFGLIGGRIFRQDDFAQYLVAQASTLDPTFTSAVT